jgi:16S rRNA (uracil1498-N3)-methyltransferase
MRISRIHTAAILATATEAALDSPTAHYLGKVLRLEAGAALCLFNGDGHEYAATIVRIDRKSCTVRVGNRRTPQTESALRTVLGLGISRGDRMDYAIQKSTELGASAFVPLFTEHCEVRLDRERQDKRREHWQQIATSACEQSGRVRIPVVHKPQALAEWVKSAPAELCLLFDHNQTTRLPVMRPVTGVALLIGPEGGLSPVEISIAHNAGFAGITLGPRVLRTETAPVAALSVLQYLWG